MLRNVRKKLKDNTQNLLPSNDVAKHCLELVVTKRMRSNTGVVLSPISQNHEEYKEITDHWEDIAKV